MCRLTHDYPRNGRGHRKTFRLSKTQGIKADPVWPDTRRQQGKKNEDKGKTHTALQNKMNPEYHAGDRSYSRKGDTKNSPKINTSNEI